MKKHEWKQGYGLKLPEKKAVEFYNWKSKILSKFVATAVPKFRAVSSCPKGMQVRCSPVITLRPFRPASDTNDSAENPLSGRSISSPDKKRAGDQIRIQNNICQCYRDKLY